MKRFILFALACMVLAVPLLASAASNPELFVIGAVVTATAFVQPQMGYNLGVSIDITELATNLGAQYRDRRDIMVSEMLLSQDFKDRFEVMNGVGDELPLPNLSLANLVKPADPANFNPTSNGVRFGSRTLKVRPMSIDLLLIPEVLMRTWLGKLKDAKDVFQMPFEAYVLDYIAQKAREEIHLNAIYRGVYNPAGTNAAATLDGYNRIIAVEIAANRITPVVTGVTTSINIIDHVEAVYDSLGEAYKAMRGTIRVKPQFFDWYNRRYRGLHGANNDYEGMKQGRILLDGTNWEILREPGLGTSNRIIATPQENMVLGVNSADMTFDFQKFNRSLKVLGDFKAGVEFKEIHARALAVNDQA